MAGVVFGCVVPHPPLLIPDVGRGQEQAIGNTIAAMEGLARRLEASRPQTAVIISPHGQSHPNAMGVVTARASSGNMRAWGSREPELHFDNDLVLVDALQEESKAAGIPLKSIGERGYELDHGVMVPIHFLAKALTDVPLVPLTFAWLPLSSHFAFGQALARAAQRAGKDVAIIASGDLSHRLTPSAPAGYDPQGQVFDEKLVEALRRFDSQAVLNLDPQLIDRAGECGLRSVVILLGAMQGLKVKPDIMSYEGHFGVGYLVAAFEVESDPAGKLHPLVQLAKDTVESFVRERKTPPPPAHPTPEMQERAGVFVSIKSRGQLRGCIGTFEPTKPNVAEEIIANAVSSATRDPRFFPIGPEELGDLEYSVDVLTRPEPVAGPEQLDPKRYGVIVESGGRRGLLLPDLEGVDSVDMQIAICRQKAGIGPEEPLKLYRFEVRRYK
ncbi:MAG TPA: AmmeMemoRadiSam system protein A [Dehalococcoidia bacterium]|nr:AmmeMemoRadiSam system protein A [Dehalococcoidia bacterium]